MFKINVVGRLKNNEPIHNYYFNKFYFKHIYNVLFKRMNVIPEKVCKR